jgi:hypothetical protein
LPVIDQVAADYQDEVKFLAVAGKADMGPTAEVANELFSDNLAWGLDPQIWELYGIPGQPATVLIAQGVVVDMWFGATSAEFLRERIDNLITLGA